MFYLKVNNVLISKLLLYHFGQLGYHANLLSSNVLTFTVSNILPIIRTMVSTMAMADKYTDMDLFLFCRWTIT